MKKRFDVRGMTCSACSAHVEKAVSKADGVKAVTVNLLNNNMTVTYDESITNDQIIIRAVQDAGYDAVVSDAVKNAKQDMPQEESYEDKERKSVKKRLIFSVIFTVPLFYLAMGHMLNWPLPSALTDHSNALAFAFTQFLLVLPVVIINGKFYRVGFKTLFKGAPNMDSLIAIGTSAALLYGIFAIYKIGYGFGHNDMDMVSAYSMDLILSPRPPS
jgi:Cu+-exporting ATPase